MLQSAMLSLLMAVVVCIVPVSSYPKYQTFIPNGNRVPNPCDRASVWQGVGHQNPAGAGVRNPFGVDFAANGHDWATVCSLDSDGDGRTNGEELGDHNCTWVKGQPSPTDDYITHPGVCEPLDSATCLSRNSWLTCPPQFSCSGIDEPGVLNMSLQLPVSTVPSQETTYICYGFVFPNDTDYHVIASTPIITNVVVVHHIILYVCRDPPTNLDVFSQTEMCLMDAFGCTSIMTGWGEGLDGDCLSDQYGYPIGPNGFKYGVLQLHWNNAYWKSPGVNFVDNSGLMIYYTPRLRPYNGQILLIGQSVFSIPPGLPSISVSGVCSNRCTSRLSGPIYITMVAIHMHLIGQSGDILIVRKDGSIVVLSNETHYYYYSPHLIRFATPIEFQPGDEFRVDCNYNSTTRTSTTMSGMSTSDEMCNAVIGYYPANNYFDQCTQWLSVDLCPINGGIYSSCDMMTMAMVEATLPQVCMPPTCSPACRNATQQIVNTECLSGDILKLLQAYDTNGAIPGLLGLVQMCDMQAPTTPAPTTPTRTSVVVPSAPAAVKCRKRNHKRCKHQKNGGRNPIKRKAYGTWVIG